MLAPKSKTEAKDVPSTGESWHIPIQRSGVLWFTKQLLKKRSAQFGGTMVALLLFFALFASYVVPYDPFDVQTEIRLTPPNLEHPFGTDELGRDLLSRILYGSRYTVIIGLIATGIGCGGGFLIGMTAAYWGRWADMILMRLMDIMLGFPYILLSLAVVAILGPSLNNAMAATGIASIPSYARLIRGFVLSAKEEEYVLAARAIGASDSRIMLRTILPNILSPMVIFITYRLPLSVLTAAALSFLGLGTQPPRPEWGAMMVNSRTFIGSASWVVTAPGLAIFVVILSMNLFGNALRDTLDPWQRGR
jgi:ABC-type dipeptide/oligopeptide/nickel transport system permease subunit